MTTDLDQLAVTTIRTLAMDAVQAANSGHPGTPMALAPLGWVLYGRHLRHDPADPQWPDRDRFVLSAGHASMLQYALLHLAGYDVSLEQLRRFRQLGSITAGHPEHFLTPGIETTTGPLGQGFGNAVGLALAEQMLAARYNRPGHQIVDHRVWVIASDGDLMEGLSSEASSLAGHLGLERLVAFWDDNRITIDGGTDLAFSEDVMARYAAYGWRVLEVADANDLDELDAVCTAAADADGRPTLVRLPTTIAWGAPTKAGTSAAHGAPLGDDEVAATKAAYGWEHPPFTVPEEVAAHTNRRERGAAARAEWDQRLDAYRSEHPELAAEFERVMAGEPPAGWDEGLPTFDSGTAMATRKASGTVLAALAPRVPELVGGSADLAASNNTDIPDGGDVRRGDFSGRILRFGVREHAMMAITNGIALHGGLRPFCATFLVFTDYLRPSLRLAALMGLPVIVVATHDSIGLGEDGPTHQPVEHLAALRAIPHLHVLRPADATEVVGAWRHALARTDGPTVLVLSRQDLPVLPSSSADDVAAGAYVVVPDDGDPDVVVIATGSEVSVAVAAAELLAESDISARVVSMPSWELFEEADDDELLDVLPPDVPVLSVEAGTTFGWARWSDDAIGLDTFGESAPASALFEHFGFTPQAVADAALDLLDEIEEDAP